jgi:hypothetical protein
MVEQLGKPVSALLAQPERTIQTQRISRPKVRMTLFNTYIDLAYLQVADAFVEKVEKCAIKLRGIPYSTKPDDILYFFKGT